MIVQSVRAALTLRSSVAVAVSLLIALESMHVGRRHKSTSSRMPRCELQTDSRASTAYRVLAAPLHTPPFSLPLLPLFPGPHAASARTHILTHPCTPQKTFLRSPPLTSLTCLASSLSPLLLAAHTATGHDPRTRSQHLPQAQGSNPLTLHQNPKFYPVTNPTRYTLLPEPYYSHSCHGSSWYLLVNALSARVTEEVPRNNTLPASCT